MFSSPEICKNNLYFKHLLWPLFITHALDVQRCLHYLASSSTPRTPRHASSPSMILVTYLSISVHLYSLVEQKPCLVKADIGSMNGTKHKP